jgi:uronate dehydrogenase
MRILSCAQPNNARALGSYLSYDDLIQLVTRCIDTPVTGFSIIYGVSNNDRAPVDNANAAFLGYHPKDNAEDVAVEVLANEPPMDPKDLGHMCHGGPFASVDLGKSGLAGMNVIQDAKETD